MPYPETLLPEPEIINLSDEDDDDEDISMVINVSNYSKKNGLSF